MRIAFFVNDIQTERPFYTTTHLALAASRRGHHVYYIGVEDFTYGDNDAVIAHARALPPGRYDDTEAYIDALGDEGAGSERLDMDELDVLMLRNNPADDAGVRPWAQTVGMTFGQAARRRGVIVLNDPDGLARGLSKLYFQAFPRAIRPRTVITRHIDEIRRFAAECGRCVLKPLQGSGGKDVFLVDSDKEANFNQIVEAIGRQGYIIAQEYLEAASEGDVRLFLMNGWPLVVDGHYAALLRRSGGDDIRNNMSAGGTSQPAEVTDAMLQIAELVRPRLVQDGMFLVGLDIVRDKVMEINVFSPGGLESASAFEGADFAAAVIEALEHKVEMAAHYRTRFDNVTLATL